MKGKHSIKDTAKNVSTSAKSATDSKEHRASPYIEPGHYRQYREVTRKEERLVHEAMTGPRAIVQLSKEAYKHATKKEK